MTKKLNWLDKFAEEQVKKMSKTASLKKSAEQIIVDSEDLPGVIDGQEVTYKNTLYKVVNANFSDEVGPGVVLEKLNNVEAAFEDGMPEEMTMEMGTNTVPEYVGKKVTDAPDRAVAEDQGVTDLHIEVRDTVEVDKYQEEATKTENQIASENAIDRTTPEGKYNRIEERIMVMLDKTVETPVVETPVTEEIECDEFVDEDLDGICDECGLVEEECPADEKTVVSNRILKKMLKK